MNLTIPDKLYKFLVLTGAIIVAFMYFQKQTFEKIYFDKIDIQHNITDSLSIELAKAKFESKQMFKHSKILSKKYNVINPLKYDKDSSLVFTQIISGTKNDLIVSDSINKMWSKTINSEKNALILLEKIKIVSERLEEEQKLKNARFENFNNYEILGYIVLGLGLGMWLISELPEQKSDEIDHYSKKLEDRTYVHCQSCGKKFTSMRKYGLEQDQITKNYAFCGQCYTNGEFIDNEVTLEGIIEESRRKNKKLPKFLQNLVIKRLKSLERWDL